MFRALIDGFRHYADFRGCTARAGFWNFVVATHLLVLLCLMPAIVEFMKFYDFMLHDTRFLDVFIPMVTDPAMLDEAAIEAVVGELFDEYMAGGLEQFVLPLVGLVLGGAVAMVVLLPTISITVRRLRDAGRSPLWVLPPVMSFLPLPFVGSVAVVLSLVTLVLCCMPTCEQLPAVPAGD